MDWRHLAILQRLWFVPGKLLYECISGRAEHAGPRAGGGALQLRLAHGHRRHYQEGPLPYTPAIYTPAIFIYISIYIYIYIYAFIYIYKYMAGGGALQLRVAHGHRRHHKKGQLIYRNVQWFRGGLVFQAHRLFYHSTPGLRVMNRIGALQLRLSHGHRGHHKQVRFGIATRWITILSSKVNLPHVTNFMALCSANLVTLRSRFDPKSWRRCSLTSSRPWSSTSLSRRSFLSFFFFTLVTGPRRSLSLKLSDERV